MPHLFDPLTVRGLTLKNRIMMSPMCQYSAGEDGLAKDWHYVHYASRAVGGVGLIMVEATSVESRGRISIYDLGIWDAAQTEPLARIASLCHENGARAGIQLAHAGRKAWSTPTGQNGYGPERPVGPSAIPFEEGWNVPHALSLPEIDEIVESFRNAASRALEAGFDVIEIHAAHGYLLNEFLSPLANQRNDEYGGSSENRMRLLHRVIDAVRSVWNPTSPMFVRVSVSDYTPGGMDVAQTVEVVRTLADRGVDLVDCSSGGVAPATIPVGPGYQVPFAHRIKKDTGMPTAAVGIITSPEMADEIIRNGRADVVVLGRELLRQPYWPLEAASELGADVEWPRQYSRAKR
jgi:NADPH2 dehydrogenase